MVGVEKEKFLLIPIGESLCILQWRGKDIFLIWFHGFFLNILLSCMQRSRLLFAGRKAHVGGHPGHNFSLPRVKKIETWSLKPRFLKYWVVYSMRDRLLEDRARPNHRKILMLLDPHSYHVGLHKSALCSISDRFPPSWIRLRTKMVDRRFTTFTRFHMMGYCFDARHTFYKRGYSYVCYGFIK